MSKALRRMLKAQELEALEARARETPEATPAPQLNPFAAMQQHSSPSEDEGTQSPPPASSPPPPPPPRAKNKKAKAKKAATPVTALPDLEEHVPPASAAEPDQSGSVLEAVLPRFNYNKELAKHFKAAVFSTQRDLSHYSRREQNMIRHTQRQNRPNRRFFLVHNEEVPTRLPYELLLEPLDDSGYFSFRPSPRMADLEVPFREVVDTHDPNALQDFLAAHPFFPDALFSLAEYFRLRKSTKEANLLLEQLLFFYEQSTPYDFGLFSQREPPQRFLDYHSSVHSQLFFRTLLLFSTVLSVRGCHRAALEYCKLLLRLDPREDPCGAVLLLPVLAVAAGQGAWLLHFARDFSAQNIAPHSSVALMPPVLLGCALALADDKLQGVANALTPRLLERVALGDWGLDAPEAATLAVLSVLLFPSLVVAVLRETGLNLQDPRLEWFAGGQLRPWSELLQHHLFQSRDALNAFFLQIPPGSSAAGMEKLTSIFSHKARLAFKTPEANLLLKAAAGFLVDAVDQQRFDAALFRSEIASPHSAIAQRLSGWRVPWGLGRYAALHLNDFSETPVEDPALAAEPAAAIPPPLQNRNWVRLFFEALLPWNPLPGAAAPPQQ